MQASKQGSHKGCTFSSSVQGNLEVQYENN